MNRPHSCFGEFLDCIGELAGKEEWENLRRTGATDLWLCPLPEFPEFKVADGIEALRTIWDRLPELQEGGKQAIQATLAGDLRYKFQEDHSAIIANAIWSCVLRHSETRASEQNVRTGSPDSKREDPQTIAVGESQVLPQLSARARRILELRWPDLIESCRLTGDDVVRYAKASEATRRLALSRPPEVRGNIDSWLIAHEHARHECGICSTERLAGLWFEDLVNCYLKVWSPSDGCELFAGWLNVIRTRTLDDIASAWKGNEAWYQDVCQPFVERAVSAMVRSFERRARNIESLALIRNEIEPKACEPAAPEEAKPKPKAQAASPTHAEAIENQKRQMRAALEEAWRQREPVQRIEDTLRPMVPGIGKLRGKPFWLQLWAYLRQPSVYGMQKPEFMDLAPEDIYALLVSGGADSLPEGGDGTEPRPAVPADKKAEQPEATKGAAKVTASESNADTARKVCAPQAAKRKADNALAQNEPPNLLLQIVDAKNISIETWAKDHKIGRTTVFDWKRLTLAGLSLKGKVSDSKRTEIESAIQSDAVALGLRTRTSSD